MRKRNNFLLYPINFRRLDSEQFQTSVDRKKSRAKSLKSIENEKEADKTNFYRVKLYSHTSLEGHLGYEKCLQGSVNGFWALLMGYFENQLSPKY